MRLVLLLLAMLSWAGVTGDYFYHLGGTKERIDTPDGPVIFYFTYFDDGEYFRIPDSPETEN